MAVTLSPVTNVTISLVDRDLNRSTIGFHVNAGVALGFIQDAITDTMIPAIEGISDAVVTGYTISSIADDPAPALAAETSDVERKGVFSFGAANGSSYVIGVPSIKNTVVIDETNKIDKANAAVIAFVQMVLDPSILDLAHPVTYLGSDITSLGKAEKHHRSSRRG